MHGRYKGEITLPRCAPIWRRRSERTSGSQGSSASVSSARPLRRSSRWRCRRPRTAATRRCSASRSFFSARRGPRAADQIRLGARGAASARGGGGCGRRGGGGGGGDSRGVAPPPQPTCTSRGLANTAMGLAGRLMAALARRFRSKYPPGRRSLTKSALKITNGKPTETLRTMTSSPTPPSHRHKMVKPMTASGGKTTVPMTAPSRSHHCSRTSQNRQLEQQQQTSRSRESSYFPDRNSLMALGSSPTAQTPSMK